jgi:hypothetical protein
MKVHRAAGLALAVLVGVAGAVEAQTRIGVGVAGGLAQPLGDFGDGYKTGWLAGAGIGVQPEGWPVGIRGIASYGSFSGDGFDGSVKPLSITGGVYLPLTTNGGGVAPYLFAGAGIASTKGTSSGGNISVSATESDLTWNGGVGVSFGGQGGGMRFFAEASFTSIATEDSASNYVPVVVGILFPLGGR